MKISIDNIQSPNPVAILRLEGDFDLVGADEFDRQVTALFQEEVGDIIVDFSKVSFMSSAGIRSINEIYYQLHPYDQDEFKEKISPGIRKGTYKAPHLKLLNPNDKVANTLKMVGLDMYLEVYTNEAEALQSFA